MDAVPHADAGSDGVGRQGRKQSRQRAITEAVMAEGAVRIDDLAERFEISQMTVHRDLDELESRGLLRKDRGVATATSSALVESSDVYRAGMQQWEKDAIAHAALDFIEPGQAIMLDDSTTVMQLLPHLGTKRPLTVITNTLTVMNELRGANGVSVLGLGGQYYHWCNAFMGRVTTEAIAHLRADLLVMSTAAIIDGIAFHQTQETADVKVAMFESCQRRILLTDHTKFGKRALHSMLPLTAFDTVIVDQRTAASDIAEMRERGVRVVVAGR